MKKTVTIGERNIEIRRLKVREVKTFLVGCHDKIDEIFAIVDGNNIAGDGLGFIVANFDWLVGFISQLTNLSLEEAEDLDVMEIAELIMALLKYHGLEMEKAKDFFTKNWLALNQPEKPMAETGMMFQEDIPQFMIQAPEITV